MSKFIIILMFSIIGIWLLQAIIFKCTWHYVGNKKSIHFWTHYMLGNITLSSLCITFVTIVYTNPTTVQRLLILLITAVGHAVFVGLVTGIIEYQDEYKEHKVKGN